MSQSSRDFGMENKMDIEKMGGSKVYITRYLGLYNKNYIEEPFRKKHKSFFGPDKIKNWGDNLFHYCTIDTLKKITENKEAILRFSDVRFLNDTTEFQETVGLLKAIIESKRTSVDEELYSILADEKIFNELNNYLQRYSFRRHIYDKDVIERLYPVCRVYTCSFSMDGDFLPMWNYYAQGAGGVSVNFCGLEEYKKVDEKEEEGEDGEQVKFIWGQVRYTEEEKKQCIEALLNDIKELFPLVPDATCRREMIQNLLVYQINNMRIFMKNENFSTEKEYRAALIVPEENIRNAQLPANYKVGHFDRGNIIIPYIDVPFASESITSIIVGPGIGEDFSFIKLGLEDWLLQKGLKNVEIYHSNIPMRKY